MTTPIRSTGTVSQPRREQLRTELLATVDSLLRRRADLVAEEAIDDYVALHWLEWSGGGLRLTLTGTNICDQMRAGMK
jgi:hypothetical protein